MRPAGTIRRLTAGRAPGAGAVRAVALATGAVAPRAVRSPAEVALLGDLMRGRRRVVQIGVGEGATAGVLCDVLEPGTELHLVDGYGRSPNARAGTRRGASEWAARRVVARAVRRSPGPVVAWHPSFSASVTEGWTLPVDIVLIDGDHSEIGVTTDWELWHPFVVEGGSVLFADARASQAGGRGLAAPTAAVDRLFRGPRTLPDWQIAAEVDGIVAVLHAARAA
ncbi:MAG: Methyltransferase domain [Solirubrobacteraceae bacterium]|nr:Methyltransferase domain [Solirubrobacteraceae bacterium]